MERQPLLLSTVTEAEAFASYNIRVSSPYGYQESFGEAIGNVQPNIDDEKRGAPWVT